MVLIFCRGVGQGRRPVRSASSSSCAWPRRSSCASSACLQLSANVFELFEIRQPGRHEDRAMPLAQPSRFGPGTSCARYRPAHCLIRASRRRFCSCTCGRCVTNCVPHRDEQVRRKTMRSVMGDGERQTEHDKKAKRMREVTLAHKVDRHVPQRLWRQSHACVAC